MYWCFPFHRELTSEGVINWDMLATGSFSSTTSRQLSSSSAGKYGLSFGLQVSGMMMKGTNLEFYFDSPINDETSRRTKLMQVKLVHNTPNKLDIGKKG